MNRRSLLLGGAALALVACGTTAPQPAHRSGDNADRLKDLYGDTPAVMRYIGDKVARANTRLSDAVATGNEPVIVGFLFEAGAAYEQIAKDLDYFGHRDLADHLWHASAFYHETAVALRDGDARLAAAMLDEATLNLERAAATLERMAKEAS